MLNTPLYPLRFEPIFKTALWGGTRLRPMFGAASSPEATGEAWVLSDHGETHSRIANGPFKGITLHQLMREIPSRILGRPATGGERFPLLLKFIDAAQPLSVQVHPNDEQARRMAGSGNAGKSETWVIVHSEPDSVLYAGLRTGITRRALVSALQAGDVGTTLHSFQPQPGDCVFLPAGTVHAIGAGLLLFEVQQTSDITYRLHDWGRVDPKTGKPRELHVEQSLACIDFGRGPCGPVDVKCEAQGAATRDRLVACDYFTLERIRGSRPFGVGASGRCRIAVAIGGTGELQHAGERYPLRPGDVLLLPAEVGECRFIPTDEVTLLECGIPDSR
jgi:mannose-6-phosphate isomerase